MTWLPDAALDRLSRAARWPEFEGTRYLAVAELGRGGMGTVYLARDEALDREVAIKVTNLSGHASLESRLRIEARILARLEHPGIVPIHDVGQLADGRLFYVMKRVDGQTLLNHIGGGLGLSERLRIFERICETVAFAHSKGFVHRDLKPANVMVGPFGEVLVLDWGVAKVLTGDDTRTPTVPGGDPPGVPAEGTEPGTVLGTRAFMAPEQARGATDDIDARTDVYGLGAMLLTLLTGQIPQPDAAAVLARLGDRHPDVPRPLRAICGRALAPAQSDRYASAQDLAADVGRFLSGEPVVAYREPLAERCWRIASKYRVPILLVVAYLVMRVLFALAARR